MNLRTCIRVLLLVAATAPAGADEPAVTVRLAPATLVDGDTLTLGDLAIVRCDDAGVYRRACGVALGRAPWPNETIRIDRRTVLSRLVASGICPEGVEFVGSEQVAVTRFGQRVSPEEIVLAARKVLPEGGQGQPGPVWRLAGMPREMFVPASHRVALVPTPDAESPNGRLRVTVSALAGMRRVSSRMVEFTASHRVRQAVATKDIAPGARLTPDNVEIRTTRCTTPESDDWQVPFGRVASRPIAAGAIVHGALAAAPRRAVVVKRNEPVIMRIAGDGFVISAIGQALEDGRPGEFIKVRNIDSKRIIVAKVAPDGTVVPGGKR